MRIQSVELRVPSLAKARAWWADTLGLPLLDAREDAIALGAGSTRIVLRSAPECDWPVYHLALRIPSGRASAARTWLAACAPLVGEEYSQRWDADLLYVLDPAGSVIELIAHRRLPERGGSGAFGVDEVIGVCEVGVPTPDPVALAAQLDAAGEQVWSGDPAGGFAAVGAPEGSLIVVREGRGWAPVERRAEVWPLVVEVEALAAPATVGEPYVSLRRTRG